MKYNQKYALLLITTLTFVLIGSNIIFNLLNINNIEKTNTLDNENTREINNNQNYNQKYLKNIILTNHNRCGDGICSYIMGENILNCPQDCMI